MADVEEKVEKCKAYLEADLDDSKLLYVLKKLAHLEITIEILQSTGIGKVVNSFRKKEGLVGEKARNIVNSWKKLVAAEAERLKEEESENEDNSPVPSEADKSSDRENEDETAQIYSQGVDNKEKDISDHKIETDIGKKQISPISKNEQTIENKKIDTHRHSRHNDKDRHRSSDRDKSEQRHKHSKDKERNYTKSEKSKNDRPHSKNRSEKEKYSSSTTCQNSHQSKRESNNDKTAQEKENKSHKNERHGVDRPNSDQHKSGKSRSRHSENQGDSKHHSHSSQVKDSSKLRKEHGITSVFERPHSEDNQIHAQESAHKSDSHRHESAHVNERHKHDSAHTSEKHKDESAHKSDTHKGESTHKNERRKHESAQKTKKHESKPKNEGHGHESTWKSETKYSKLESIDREGIEKAKHDENDFEKSVKNLGGRILENSDREFRESKAEKESSLNHSSHNHRSNETREISKSPPKEKIRNNLPLETAHKHEKVNIRDHTSEGKVVKDYKMEKGNEGIPTNKGGGEIESSREKSHSHSETDEHEKGNSGIEKYITKNDEERNALNVTGLSEVNDRKHSKSEEEVEKEQLIKELESLRKKLEIEKKKNERLEPQEKHDHDIDKTVSMAKQNENILTKKSNRNKSKSQSSDSESDNRHKSSKYSSSDSDNYRSKSKNGSNKKSKHKKKAKKSKKRLYDKHKHKKHKKRSRPVSSSRSRSRSPERKRHKSHKERSVSKSPKRKRHKSSRERSVSPRTKIARKHSDRSPSRSPRRKSSKSFHDRNDRPLHVKYRRTSEDNSRAGDLKMHENRKVSLSRQNSKLEGKDHMHKEQLDSNKEKNESLKEKKVEHKFKRRHERSWSSHSENSNSRSVSPVKVNYLNDDTNDSWAAKASASNSKNISGVKNMKDTNSNNGNCLKGESPSNANIVKYYDNDKDDNCKTTSVQSVVKVVENSSISNISEGQQNYSNQHVKTNISDHKHVQVGLEEKLLKTKEKKTLKENYGREREKEKSQRREGKDQFKMTDKFVLSGISNTKEDSSSLSTENVENVKQECGHEYKDSKKHWDEKYKYNRGENGQFVSDDTEILKRDEKSNKAVKTTAPTGSSETSFHTASKSDANPKGNLANDTTKSSQRHTKDKDSDGGNFKDALSDSLRGQAHEDSDFKHDHQVSSERHKKEHKSHSSTLNEMQKDVDKKTEISVHENVCIEKERTASSERLKRSNQCGENCRQSEQLKSKMHAHSDKYKTDKHSCDRERLSDTHIKERDKEKARSKKESHSDKGIKDSATERAKSGKHRTANAIEISKSVSDYKQKSYKSETETSDDIKHIDLKHRTRDKDGIDKSERRDKHNSHKVGSKDSSGRDHKSDDKSKSSHSKERYNSEHKSHKKEKDYRHKDSKKSRSDKEKSHKKEDRSNRERKQEPPDRENFEDMLCFDNSDASSVTVASKPGKKTENKYEDLKAKFKIKKKSESNTLGMGGKILKPTHKRKIEESEDSGSPKKAFQDAGLTDYLPSTQAHYRPFRYGDVESKKTAEDNEMPFLGIKSNTRTQVYSGKKQTGVTEMHSLFDLCMRILQDNIDSIDYVGGIPLDILKPVLEKCTPKQLYDLEDYNPHFLEDSDYLWKVHCEREFRGCQPEEMETWRELYLRKFDEREQKFKSIKANISKQMASAAPARKVQLAYMDNVAKPPREVRRQQIKFGTSNTIQTKPGAGNSVKNRFQGVDMIALGREKQQQADRHAQQASKGPMMQKTLTMMKNLYRR